jgi:hypothetical protein
MFNIATVITTVLHLELKIKDNKKNCEAKHIFHYTTT